ncbi:MAG: 3-methyl-2-oxobutanoate hydroxymethyltransferase [Thermodesulfobacteriota bacterium]|nr:MAG: 3-methyl-2-oxobutanoate hydroxymethyltransferase [Thermodesulfobacteriota bacterium]
MSAGLQRKIIMKKVTVPEVLAMKGDGRKIAVLTAYDFTMARILDMAGVPVILVGDSAGMVSGGYETTLPVTMEEMLYHTRAVSRGVERALVIGDMPFASYQVSTEHARGNAARFVKEGYAAAIKLEGGKRSFDAIKAIVDMDIPVMGHIGLTPQSVHRFGGYRVQGRPEERASEILEDARAVQEAGAFAMVLEGIPASLAAEITAAVRIPTIGIGAGPHCDGQVLVVNDMLGLTTGMKRPRFVKEYSDLKRTITRAVKKYIKEVEEKVFPDEDHSY